jgi:virulence-associated protein VapD
MFAITFDLDYVGTLAWHPAGTQTAYREIARVLNRRGFRRVQQSFFVSDGEDMTAITWAMTKLKALPWCADCVKDLRACRVEARSDFAPFMKEN